jgi:hypothetical protein
MERGQKKSAALSLCVALRESERFFSSLLYLIAEDLLLYHIILISPITFGV